MFNPFSVFEPRFLAGFKQKGVKAFVQQTYDRGKNLLETNPGAAFLLIHFNDAQKAREHYDAIKSDANRKLYLTDNENDWKELSRLINQPAGQRFYTILTVPDVNNKARKALDKKIRAYVDFKTNWRPASQEQVGFSLDVIFGEIYARLKYGPREVKLKLDELENQQGYVL